MRGWGVQRSSAKSNREGYRPSHNNLQLINNELDMGGGRQIISAVWGRYEKVPGLTRTEVAALVIRGRV